MRALSSRNTLSKIVLRNQIDKIRLLFRKDRESYLCFYRILGFYPHNIQIYEQALLHKSSAVRSEKGRPLNNERLEFLGDAILDASRSILSINVSRETGRFPDKHTFQRSYNGRL